jgi:transposase
MRVLHERVAGVDVHPKSVYATVRKMNAGKPEVEKRRFGTMTDELLKLGEWFAQEGVTHAAMESTGVYWRPVHNILEGTVEVVLCNAQHVKQVPGRKSDASDSEWLAELMQYGLLNASFIPRPAEREMRELTRTRLALVQEKTEHVNRIQKVLETANLKLAQVASDVMGVSGRRILSAICQGRDDPGELAQLAKGALKKKEEDLTRALTGRVSDHHRFLLSMHLEMVVNLEKKIAVLSERIERRMQENEQGPDALPFVAAVQLLKTAPGIGDRTAQIVLGEIGLDMNRFPSDAQLCSWAGLAPGMNTSGERRKPAHLKKGNVYLKSVLVQAAWAAIKKKGTSCHDLFCRVTRKSGKQTAICAVAHSLLVSIYHMLKGGVVYHDIGPMQSNEVKQEKARKAAVKQLEALGYEVTLKIG